MASQRKVSIGDVLILSGFILILVWVIHFFSWLLNVDLGGLGVRPREIAGLVGIVTMPFIHGGWDHLMSNSVPLFVLTAGILFFYPKVAVRAILLMWLTSGLLVWALARGGTAHVGASGIVYAFAAFLFFSGVFRRDTAAIIVALLVAFFYGSMVWGIFPTDPHVSWEGHLMGAISGIFYAWILRKLSPMPKKKYSWDLEPEQQGPDENPYWDYPKDPPPWNPED